MDTKMRSTNDIGLVTERVQGSTQIDLSELVCSTICENILWKPISCQQCETHFCSTCIRQWLTNHPDQCPMRCNTFIERPCSKLLARQLAKLQVVCIYQPNGCKEVIPYEALEKHEMTCRYQLVKCTGCQLEILKKNLTEHQSQCQQITTICAPREIVYEQNDAEERHSDIIFLREQLQQLRQDSQYEIQQLKEQIRQAQNDQITFLVSRGIIADDNHDTARRVEIKSTVEIDTLHRNRIVLDSQSQSSLTGTVICSECGNVFWKPVSCRNCGTVFCEKCCPKGGILGKISSFFSIQRKQHGTNNCEKFDGIPIPSQVTNNLARLRIRCVYAPNGCRVISSYYDLERHEQTCEFEMIPCQLCQLPLPNRPPIVQHTRRACFEHMRDKNPAGIQQQFMILFNAMEETKAENHRLESTIKQIQAELKTLKSIHEKQDDKINNK